MVGWKGTLTCVKININNNISRIKTHSIKNKGNDTLQKILKGIAKGFNTYSDSNNQAIKLK